MPGKQHWKRPGPWQHWELLADPGLTMRVRGDLLGFVRGDETVLAYKFSLDPTKTPKRLDARCVGGTWTAFHGCMMLSVYRLEGERLTVLDLERLLLAPELRAFELV